MAKEDINDIAVNSNGLVKFEFVVGNQFVLEWILKGNYLNSLV